MKPFHSISAILLPGMIVLSLSTIAQYKEDYARSAAIFYSNGDYFSSAKYYELYLDTDSRSRTNKQHPYVVQKQEGKTDVENPGKSKARAIYQLAESYRRLNDYAHAEKWYGLTSDPDITGYPLARYWYGICLRANGKYPAAEKTLQQFIRNYGQNDTYLQSAKKELQNLAFIREQLQQKDSTAYSIHKLGGTLNAPGYANYAPAFAGNTVYFTSTRRDGVTRGKETAPYVNNLYRFVTADTANTAVAGVPDSDQWEQGASSITPDRKKMYLTRWHKEKDKKTTLIYTSEQQESGAWSTPVPADSSINQPGYQTQQPSITADGRYLFFASDRPGGAGGFDIWYIALDAHQQAVNAGKQINTAFDELTPYYHTSGTLVFASDGRTGMGGFDLYTSKGDIAAGQWTTPENMGYPLNSVKDDLYFTSNGEGNLLTEAYLSSDRSSACCLELFAIKMPQPDTARPQPPVVIQRELPAPPPTVITSNNNIQFKIYFAFDKSDLIDSSYGILDSLAMVMTKVPQLLVEIAGYADGKGSEEYNIALSGKRAGACLDYLVHRKQIQADRLAVKAYGECCQAEKETTADGKDNPAGRQQNRRVEFKVSGIR